MWCDIRACTSARGREGALKRRYRSCLSAKSRASAYRRTYLLHVAYSATVLSEISGARGKRNTASRHRRRDEGEEGKGREGRAPQRVCMCVTENKRRKRDRFRTHRWHLGSLTSRQVALPCFRPAFSSPFHFSPRFLAPAPLVFFLFPPYGFLP